MNIERIEELLVAVRSGSFGERPEGEEFDANMSGLIKSVKEKLNSLTRVQQLEFLCTSVELCMNRYLTAVRPNGHVERLSLDLSAAALNERLPFSIRLRASDQLHLLSVEIQDGRAEQVMVALEELKLFTSWYCEQIEPAHA